MRVIKKINNNVAICMDCNQNELVAFGKGIGFPAMPYELTDLSCIHRTYYGIKASYLGLLNEIPEVILNISAEIVDIAKMKLENEINANIVLTLADHINFAVQRYKKGINMNMPFSYDIQYLYEKEMNLGELAVRKINKELSIHLPAEEAKGIALHFINAQNIQQNLKNEVNEAAVIQDLTGIIEQEYDIKINRKGFNYSRFVTHLQYLLKRNEEQVSINSENKKLYDAIRTEFPKTYHCAVLFKEYLTKSLDWTPSEEELLYLMLHINRLCAREDCNQ